MTKSITPHAAFRLGTLLLSFIALVASLSPVSSQGADEFAWGGVWQLTQKLDEGPTVFYLHVRSNGKFDIYGEGWEPLGLEDASIVEEQFQGVFELHKFRLSVKAQRRGFRLQGEWTLFHPQYRSEGKLTGYKIISSADWEPLGEANRLRREGVLDLTGHLYKGWKESTDFDTYWSRVKHEHYLVLDNPPAAETVRKSLEEGNLLERASFFRQGASAARKQAAKLMAEATSDQIYLVGLPYGPISRQTFLAQAAILSFNTNQIVSASQARSLVTESLLKAGLRPRLPEAPIPATELYRVGVPILLARELGGSSRETEFLALDAGQIRDISRRIPELKSKLGSVTMVKVADRTSGLAEDDFRLLSYRFAQYLKSTPRSNEELYKIPVQEIRKEYLKFIGAS